MIRRLALVAVPSVVVGLLVLEFPDPGPVVNAGIHNPGINSGLWWLALLLVIPVFYAARAGWGAAAAAFVIASGAQFVIAQVYVDRDRLNQMAGMVYLLVLLLMFAFLAAALAGIGSRYWARRGQADAASVEVSS